MIALILLSFILLSTTSLTSIVVHGWGNEGHEIVGNVAYKLLPKTTQSRIREILDDNDNYNDDDDDYNTPLGKVSTWADDIKHNHDYLWSSVLHYVNLNDEQVDGGCHEYDKAAESACHFHYNRDCSKNVCAIGAIVNYTHQLLEFEKTTTTITPTQLRGRGQQQQQNDQQQSIALKFITHFVGDIHQPLHTSRGSDRGGNNIHVTFDETLQHHHHHHADNLHSVWDSGIIHKAMREEYNNSQHALQYDIYKNLVPTATNTLLLCQDGNNHNNCHYYLNETVIEWANEGFTVAFSSAYRTPQGKEVQNGMTLAYDYYETRLPIVKQRLAIAAIRLASLLQWVFFLDNDNNDQEQETGAMSTFSSLN